jgi:hypothetical protein
MIPESASRARRLAALSARVRAQRLQVGGEDGVGAELRLDAHRGGEVGGAQQRPQLVAGEHELPEHPIGAVDEREALLLCQRDRGDAGRGEGLRSRTQRAVAVADLALAHHHERAVRQRGEITGAAERAVIADHRGDPGAEDSGVRPGGLQPDPGAPGGEGRQPQQHQRADHLALDLGAGPGGVRADQAALQRGTRLDRDVPGGKRPEPGGDAVVRLGVVGERLDDLAAAGDLVLGLG